MTMKKKPVILQILPELESGGVERGAVDLSNHLQERGYGSFIASAGGKMTSSLKSGVTHIKLPLESKNPVTIWRNVAKLEKVIKKYNVKIIHARSRAPAWSAYFAAKRTGCKFVTTVHGTYSIGGNLKKKYNSVMTRGEKVIVVSNFIKKYVTDNYDIDESKIKIIHRGADINEFNPELVSKDRVDELIKQLNIVQDKPTILLPGRYSSWKGHELLIDALANIKNDFDFQCIFVGKINKHPAYMQRISKKIADYDLLDKISIHDSVSDMPALYLASDIIISASTKPEAFGRIAIEAQAMGKILIATNHGGSCETVINGETGFLVENNNVSDFANILRTCMSLSGEEKQLISTKSINHIKKNFSLQKMIDDTISLYDDIDC